MHSSIRNWLRGMFCALLFTQPSAFSAQPDLGQGWSDADRDFFYYTTQGSRLLRRDWFLALERHDSQDLFLADGLTRFRYLAGPTSAKNPDKLPIGFVVDKDWIGMTCAACHTNEIAYRGMLLRVDGAPADADMYEFLAKLDLALQKAANDEAAFLRFAAKVLGTNNTAASRTRLRDTAKVGLRAVSQEFAQFVIDSTPASPWGPARLDAFGMIFNRVTSIDLGLPGNSEKPNAPVSYPFLWGAPYHAVTQWNGSMPNDSVLLRLARNMGQVLGVFGGIDFTNPPPYPSSSDKQNLVALEAKVKVLKAPVWPATVFGAIDIVRAKRGEALFVANDCQKCHSIVQAQDQLKAAPVFLSPLADIKTDGAMATAAATRESRTGILEGRSTITTAKLGVKALSFDILRHAVAGSLFGPQMASLSGSEGAKAYELKQLFAPALNVPKYKARPLNGVWATAPYLHNGSVRTLYQLLLPESGREEKFFVGSREFDPVHVGFINSSGPIPFELDTGVRGNRNSGHEYGTQLSHEERLDLVEYLKGL